MATRGDARLPSAGSVGKASIDLAARSSAICGKSRCAIRLMASSKTLAPIVALKMVGDNTHLTGFGHSHYHPATSPVRFHCNEESCLRDFARDRRRPETP